MDFRRGHCRAVGYGRGCGVYEMRIWRLTKYLQKKQINVVVRQAFDVVVSVKGVQVPVTRLHLDHDEQCLVLSLDESVLNDTRPESIPEPN